MREALGLQQIHNQAPESFNLTHFALPSLPPVPPNEHRFGKVPLPAAQQHPTQPETPDLAQPCTKSSWITSKVFQGHIPEMTSL